MQKKLFLLFFINFCYLEIFSSEDPFQNTHGMHSYDYAVMTHKKPHLIPSEWRDPLLKACEGEVKFLSTSYDSTEDSHFNKMLESMKILVVEQIFSRGDASKGGKIIKEIGNYFPLELKRWETRVTFLKNKDLNADELSEPSFLLCYTKEETNEIISRYDRWRTFLLSCLEVPKAIAESYHKVFVEKYANSVNPDEKNKFVSGMDPYEHRILYLRHTSEVQKKLISFVESYSKSLLMLIDYLNKQDHFLHSLMIAYNKDCLENGMRHLKSVLEEFSNKISATEEERKQYLQEQEAKKQQTPEDNHDLSDTSSTSSKEKRKAGKEKKEISDKREYKPKVKLQVKPSVLNLSGLGSLQEAKRNLRHASPRPSANKNSIKRAPGSENSIEPTVPSTSEHSSSSSSKKSNSPSQKFNKQVIVSSLGKIGESAKDLKRTFSEQISPRRYFSGSAETDESSISSGRRIIAGEEEEGYSAGSEESEDDQTHDDKKSQGE